MRDFTFSRKHVLKFFLGFVFLFSSYSLTAQILAWDFTGESAVADSDAEIIDLNLAGSNLITRGSGAPASAGANSFRTTGFRNDGIAVTNTDYFQFSLEASTGYELSLSSIEARFAGTASFAASPGVSHQYAYSLDGVTFELIGDVQTTVGSPAQLTTDISAVAALQNIPSGTTITFRYYASGQTTTGGWGFNSPSAGAYGLAINGAVVVPTCDTESFIEETACQTYDFHGNELTMSGDYQHVLDGANAAGCDSTVNLSLTIVSGFTYYADVDMDGFGDPNVTIEACSLPVGYVENADDCDDTDDQIGAVSEVYYVDADGDGFGAGDPILFCSDPGAGYSTNNDDCDDTDDTIYPGATEIPDDGIDQNCDGTDASVYGTQIGIYEFNGTTDCNTQDVEASVGLFNVSFSDFTSENTSCSSAGGVFNRNNWNISPDIDLTQYNEFSLNTDDCFELALTKLTFDHRVSNVTSVPTWFVRSSIDGFAADLASGNSGTTVANAEIILGSEFENVTNVTFRFYLTSVTANTTAWRNDNVAVYGFENTLTPTTFYADLDGDGFGDLNNTIQACTQPEGYVTNDGDCDDTDDTINPNTVWYLDNDGDGFGDDANTVQTCEEPFGATYVLVGGDCDDDDDTVYPGAPELCDGKDNDCNGSIDDGLEFTTYYVDADGDGFGAGDAMEFCEDPGAGYVTNNDDCDDTDENITVASTYYLDNDGDGFGDDDNSIESCDVPVGNYVLVGGDCDDDDDTVYPGAPEICDGKDNDCNGLVDDGLEFVTYYVDADGDGFGAGDGIELCEDPGDGYSTVDGDCNDDDPTIYPGAPEIPNDGIDQNCDGEDLVTIGLNENVQLSFSIVPNPTRGDIVIKLSESYASNNLEVYALTGELVASTRFNGAVVTMDLSELNTGMYLIKITNDAGTTVQRVVKK